MKMSLLKNMLGNFGIRMFNGYNKNETKVKK